MLGPARNIGQNITAHMLSSQFHSSLRSHFLWRRPDCSPWSRQAIRACPQTRRWSGTPRARASRCEARGAPSCGHLGKRLGLTRGLVIAFADRFVLVRVWIKIQNGNPRLQEGITDAFQRRGAAGRCDRRTAIRERGDGRSHAALWTRA